MPIWYHGTTKELANLILKDGFKKGAYFARELDSAYQMGGEYLFWVFFPKEPTKCWEYITPRKISPSRILMCIKLSHKFLYYSDECDKLIRYQSLKENYGSSAKVCGHCKGAGQMEPHRRLEFRWRDVKKITVCPKCHGHGITNYKELVWGQKKKK